MVAGSMYWKTDRQKRKEFDAAVAERKVREKNEAWIRELEARDEEEKQIRAAKEARRNNKAGGGENIAPPMVGESEGSRGTLGMVSDWIFGRK